MRTLLLTLIAVCFGVFAQAQTNPDITDRNSWLKFGVNLGAPVSDISNVSSFVGGLELKGQLMETPHFGIGLTTGYNHFFPKENSQNFGTIPLGAFIRVYPGPSGFFAGLDAGYSVITGIRNADGGAYLKPQLGYHNYDWNIFGFYNHIFRSDANGAGIAHLGLGITRNLRFN